MKIDQRILDRLTELVGMGERVASTRYSRSGGGIVWLGDDGVDFEQAYQWGTSCLSIINRVFGSESDHYKKFNDLFKEFHDYGPVTKALGILKSGKEEYERDFLFETHILIEAEVFDDFLEQAEHLLATGYFQPAAVVAGCVLEDGLRRLCQRKLISVAAKPKIDQMNSDLAKHGVYNQLIQKRITMLADIRNKAAHGQWNGFNEGDVEDMIKQIRSFMEANFS